MPSVRYVVKDEHTLGYIDSRSPFVMGVLHGNPFKGGHNWKNGCVSTFGSVIRPATLSDFDDYRCSVPSSLAFDEEGHAQPLKVA